MVSVALWATLRFEVNSSVNIRVCSGHGPGRSGGSKIGTGSKILTVVITVVPYTVETGYKVTAYRVKSVIKSLF